MTVIKIKKIQNLPFFCGVQNSPYRDNLIPDDLPFSLGLSSSEGLIVQIPDKKVLSALETSYREEELFLTSPMDESPLTQWRGDEFIDVLSNKAKIAVDKKNLLEIGCSTGYLLNEFKKMGAIVRGCEPGPSAHIARERYGLDVDKDFFRPELYKDQYDIVILLTVLEHVENPVDFLKEILGIIKPGGYIFLGVPDCESQLLFGDPAMMVHEHWSYFTLNSLRRLLHSVGFNNVNCIRGKKGDLYGWGRLDESCCPEYGYESLSDSDMIDNYVNNLGKIIKKVNEWFHQARTDGKTIGLYGANAATNLLALTEWQGVSLNLYDTDPLKHGKYIPCCELKIKSPDDLMKNMPDSILILPLNFAESIRTYLNNDLNLPSNVKVLTLKELIN